LGIKFCQILLQRYPEIKKLIIFSRNKGRQKEAAQILKHHPKLIFYAGDLLQKRKLKKITKGVDYIVHAVEYRPSDCGENTTDLINTYIQGTQNLIEAAITNNVARVLNMSANKACNPVAVFGY
jgi:FlaA1/EpsC-like NDP-sugar epimerase